MLGLAFLARLLARTAFLESTWISEVVVAIAPELLEIWKEVGVGLASVEEGDLVQFIDARDLGEWYVWLVEANTTGTFNGVGPRSPMSVAG